jgi:hypothetical protein
MERPKEDVRSANLMQKAKPFSRLCLQTLVEKEHSGFWSIGLK